MALLSNLSHPFGGLNHHTGAVAPWDVTISPIHNINGQQLATNTNNLLYSPADHQQDSQNAAPPPPGSNFYINNPYGPPQVPPASPNGEIYQARPQQDTSYQFYNSKSRLKQGNSYLPPTPTQQQQQHHQQQQQQQQQNHIYYSRQQQMQLPQRSSGVQKPTSFGPPGNSVPIQRTYGEQSYANSIARPPISVASNSHMQDNNNNNLKAYNGMRAQPNSNFISPTAGAPILQLPINNQQQQQQQQPQINTQQNINYQMDAATSDSNGSYNNNNPDTNLYPERAQGFTRVTAGQGSRTQVHAVLDYDAEDDEDSDDGVDVDGYDTSDRDRGTAEQRSSSYDNKKTVTPIQGPLFVQNGSMPVVPLFSYPTLNNGSLVQIPILWTALSVALGLDVRGDLIKGIPCIKRNQQLFCPTAGNNYPIEKIERFIDENKALMRRMYGDFEMLIDPGGPRQKSKARRRRFIDEPDIFLPPGTLPSSIVDQDEANAEEPNASFFGKLHQRKKRQTNANKNGQKNQPISDRMDACESKIEIVTPYWASNSAGKIRAIVNTQHFEQAIHQEICSIAETPRCRRDCGCEQKYKWHRLLAYDPDNDCKGIFMDWFLFPSCCVCRCSP